MIGIRPRGLLKQIVLRSCFPLDAQPKRRLRRVHGMHRFSDVIPTSRLRFLPGRWRETGHHGLDRHILIRRNGLYRP